MFEHHPEETMAVVASDPDFPELPDELVDELLAGARTPEEITGPEGLLQRLTKRHVLERPCLPLPDVVEHRVGDAGDQVVADLDPVQLLPPTGSGSDVARRVAPRTCGECCERPDD